MSTSELDRRLKEAERFEGLVVAAFAFLESEFNYARGELRRLDFEYLKDAQVFVPYSGTVFGIRVVLAFADAYMGVNIVELRDGVVPDRVAFVEKKDYPRGVDLETILAARGVRSLDDILPGLGGHMSLRTIERQMNERAKILRTKMGVVLDAMSARLRTAASDILAGDRRMFDVVFAEQSPQEPRNEYDCTTEGH